MSEDYEFIENIGQGAHGQVLKAINKKENKLYAIKRLNFKDISEKERKNIEKEVKLLKELKHPNIISYKDSFEDKDNYYNIVTLFCEGGDMYNKILHQNGEYFSEEQILNWMVQILLGLSYVHDQKIIHRDIKPQNIFIQNKYKICIGDFGIAKIVNQTQTLKTTMIQGTPLYMSPESFNDPKSCNYKSDIWSLGCCLFEMCNLKHAFGADSWNAVFIKVKDGKRASLNKRYSIDLRNIIDSTLNVKQINRPTISQILETNFLRPKVGLYIKDFVENYQKYDGNLEQVSILKNQAEKFGIFKNVINKDINNDDDYEKLKNQELKKFGKKNNINNNKGSSQENEEKKKINSLDKQRQKCISNYQNLENYYENDNKYNRYNISHMYNENKKKHNNPTASPVVRHENVSLKKKVKRPVTSKKISQNVRKGNENNKIKNNISIVKEKEKNNNLKNKENNNNNEIDNSFEMGNENNKKNNEGMSNKEIIINERINYFKNRCIKALGENLFLRAYDYLLKIKQNKNNNNIDSSKIRGNLVNIFGKSNIGYWQLIDQILFFEDFLNDK